MTLNNSQTTLTTIPASDTCSFCRIGPAFSAGLYPANKDRPNDVASYLVITAYSINSAFTTVGDCVTITGTSVLLPTPFSVVTTPEPSATNPKTIQSIIESDFPSWLHRAPTCSWVGTCLDNECFSSTDDESGLGFHNLGSSDLVIPIVVLVVVALTGLVWHMGQNHYRRAAAMKKGKRETPHEPRTYLQQKAELDAEATRKHELEARDRRSELEGRERYEMEGNRGRAEMSGVNGEGGLWLSSSSSERHELRSEEHARELHGDDD